MSFIISISAFQLTQLCGQAKVKNDRDRMNEGTGLVLQLPLDIFNQIRMITWRNKTHWLGLFSS